MSQNNHKSRSKREAAAIDPVRAQQDIVLFRAITENVAQLDMITVSNETVPQSDFF